MRAKLDRHHRILVRGKEDASKRPKFEKPGTRPGQKEKIGTGDCCERQRPKPSSSPGQPPNKRMEALPMPTTPRFIVIVTPGKEKRYRVFDRLSKNSYCATDDREVAQELAREFCRTYARPWYVRLFAWALRQPLPEPTPDPVDVPELEPIPEWKQRLARINAHIEDHKTRERIAGGGSILESDSIN